MATTNILLAGFGGQGILFAGKVLAYAGLLEDKQVSWLPSYGPEMRGGTANCSICISDEPIGSPLVLEPEILMVMNAPSYDKFIDTVAPGGVVVVDSTLVHKQCERKDVSVHATPATKLAGENELSGLANIVLLGKLLTTCSFVSEESIDKAIEKCVPAAKAHLVAANKRAIALGKAQ